MAHAHALARPRSLASALLHSWIAWLALLGVAVVILFAAGGMGYVMPAFGIALVVAMALAPTHMH